MKSFSRLLTAVGVAAAALLWAQNSPVKQAETRTILIQGPVDVLTDVKGVDFSEYLPKIIRKIRFQWYDRIPLVAKAPTMKRGMVTIGFRVLKDGDVQNVKYLDRSGDVSLDEAALESVQAANPLPAPPADVSCQFIELRFHFYYNPQAGDRKPDSQHELLPCVTTTLHLDEDAELRVSPSASQVSVGTKEQFLASIKEDTNPTVTWSISGTNCSDGRCGTISASGLYSAPDAVPDVPTITVTAVLSSGAGKTASATLTIVKARSFQ